MSKQWTAKTLPPVLADTSQWRYVDADALNEADRARFLKYQAAIVAYLRTGKIAAISKELDLPRNCIIRQMNRCVTLAADGKPFGWVALIPGYRIHDYRRTADLPTVRHESGGTRAGAIHAFMLAHPEIKQRIDNLILRGCCEIILKVVLTVSSKSRRKPMTGRLRGYEHSVRNESSGAETSVAKQSSVRPANGFYQARCHGARRFLQASA